MIHQYNDSELLYLMYEGCDIALGILFSKYSNLIKKRLIGFRIHHKNYEDFFQEGLMMLFKACNTYNPYFGKTFNKYFDMILQRKIIAILRQERHYFYDVVLVEDACLLLREQVCNIEEEYSFNFTQQEEDIFILKYYQNKPAREIAKILGLNTKKVYNILFSIKQKINVAKEK